MKYRKKPIEVEAFRFLYDSLPKWGTILYDHDLSDNVFCSIASNSRHIVERGEWIVKQGDRISILTNEQFLENYEAVE